MQGTKQVNHAAHRRVLSPGTTDERPLGIQCLARGCPDAQSMPRRQACQRHISALVAALAQFSLNLITVKARTNSVTLSRSCSSYRSRRQICPAAFIFGWGQTPARSNNVACSV